MTKDASSQQDEVHGVNAKGPVPVVVKPSDNNNDANCSEQHQRLFSVGDTKEVAIRSIVRSAVEKQVQLMQDLKSEINLKFNVSQDTVDMMWKEEVLLQNHKIRLHTPGNAQLHAEGESNQCSQAALPPLLMRK